MKTRLVVPAVTTILAALAPCTASAATFGWTSGKLTDFIAENTENGFSLPLTEPNELSINTSGSVLVDASLGNESTILAQRGLIAIAEGHDISNASTGEFTIGEISQIIAIGDPELSVFENEGLVRKVGDRMTTISARFVLFNGGTVDAPGDTILRLTNADIRNNSAFTGTGQVRVSGLVSGEIHSENSLVIGSTTGTSLTTAEDVIISGGWRWSGPIAGHWTNLGLAVGSPINQGQLGELLGGTQFVNEGTVSGVFMKVNGNEGSFDIEDQTRFTNNGVLEFDGPATFVGGIGDTKMRSSGDVLTRLINNGVLRVIDSNDTRNRNSLGEVIFENRGTIDVVEGSSLDIGSVGDTASLTGGVFLHGTRFTGGGMTRLIGTVNTRHLFSGVIFSENLRLGAGMNTIFHGEGATLLGSAEWTHGTMTGAWFSGATLSLFGNGSGVAPPTIAGIFTNTGILQQNNRLHLLDNATLVNFGLYALTGGVANDIVGSASSLVDSVSNLGQFHTQSSFSSFNTISDLHFINHGVMQITSQTILRNTVLENFGTIIGTGTLRIDAASTFTNDGTIAPGLSPGTLNISGDFSNGPNGVIEIEMASATVFDVLRISGDVNLGGTLRIKLLDGFMPDLDTPFTFLRYEGFTGAFDDVVLDGFNGTQFSLNYGATSFGLGFTAIPAPVPLPPAWMLFASAVAMFKWRSSRRATGPQIQSRETIPA